MQDQKVKEEIGSLWWKDEMVENSLEMARVYNEHIGSVFTRKTPLINLQLTKKPKMRNC